MYYDIYDNNIDDIDDKHDDENQNYHILANFQARSSKYCMVIHLDSTCRLMTILMMMKTKMMMIMMMLKIQMAKNQ